MIIKVKAKHIREGKPGYTNCCPVALAIKEQLQDYREIAVERDEISLRQYIELFDPNSGPFKILGSPLTYKTPRRVKRFINKFDNESSVNPFNFRLDLDRPQ